MKALIIVSGGMDSVTLLHQYKQDIIMGLSFDYQSNHNEKELPFARQNCAKLGVIHYTVKLPFVKDLFNSALLQGAEAIPEGHYTDPSQKKTVVPFRNGIMLSIAAGVAESHGLDTVLIGNHAGDHAIYPDCRRTFIKPMSQAIKQGTYAHIKLMSPYQNLTKRQIAVKGKKYGVDYKLTWSCYKGEDTHCGKCGSCVERKEALHGFDETEYSA